MKNYSFFILLILFTSISAAALDYSSAWFQPELTINEDSICESILQQTKKLHQGLSNHPLPPSQKEDGSYYPPSKVTIDGKTVYLLKYLHPGCGSACDTYQLLASNTPIPEKKDNAKLYQSLLKISPPPVDELYFIQQNEQSYYLFTPIEGSKQVHRLTKNAAWELVCNVATKPSNKQIKSIEHDYKEVNYTLDNLKNLTLNLIGESGYGCGSMATHPRLVSRLKKEFSKLTYQPRKSYTSFNNYKVDLTSLELWSFYGLSQFQNLQEFKAYLPLAITKLSNFYQKNFQWSKEDANKLATISIQNAISSGMNFSYDYSHDINQIRKAILQQEPIDKIKALDNSYLQELVENEKSYGNYESILNSAVKHPKALAYLLELGFNPNTKNGFHKTPLMYAAQYNNYESAKLLIQAGTKINTGTIIPDNTCAYTLKTSNISPLHYAVRYADKELIKLLLKNGASKYFDVKNHLKSSSSIEYPINWLTRFTNENLTTEDRAELQQLLALEPIDKRKILSKNLNLQGENLYSENRIKAAQEKFNNAVQVYSNNIKALNNYALASLRVGNKKLSLQASKRVINSDFASKQQKASAYFNAGLACEGKNRYDMVFDGESHCWNGSLEYFIKSHREHPTQARAKFLIEHFKNFNLDENICHPNYWSFIAVYKNNSDTYFLHRSSMEETLDRIARIFPMNSRPEIIKKNGVLIREYETALSDNYFLSKYRANIHIPEDFAFKTSMCN